MEHRKTQIIHGDSLIVLPQLEPGSFDALITDPPYASGGLSLAERQKSPLQKYSRSGAKGIYEYFRHEFRGDSLDQRAWTHWAAHWLGLCRTLVKPGGVAAVFIDWRQLASLYDAIQWAGWIIRGLLAWDKINARPQPARPRQQCEFVVWASNGPLSLKRPAPYLPGLLQYNAPAPQKRTHQTEKSLDMMRQLVHICETGGRILDPFAGSGTTICAAELEGFSGLGIEVDEYHARKAQERLENIIRKAG